MSRNGIPDINPSQNNNLAGLMQFAFQKFLQNTDGMLPARILRYDRQTNTAAVQALINVVTTDNEQIARPEISQVPVLRLGGGDFCLHFDLKPGDLGWILANDRDISAFLQTYVAASPGSGRMHSFSDALFIPDAMKGFAISEDDAGAMVIQNKDGTVKISLSNEKIKIVAPIVEIDGEINMTGDLFVDGNILATGTITPGGG